MGLWSSWGAFVVEASVPREYRKIALARATSHLHIYKCLGVYEEDTVEESRRLA